MASNNQRGDAQRGVIRDMIQMIRSDISVSNRNLGPIEADHGAAVALQRAWRTRRAYMFVKDLKQEKLCRQQREEMRAGLHVDCEACASAGKKSADVKSRNLKKAWKDADELLFKGMTRLQMSDRGDNWNERWQAALALPNQSKMEIQYKRLKLDAVYSDFVHTAVTYGRTIISEYFLHEYMKSVKPKRLGGVAGGKKYLWRGIMFKLADGSQGPYGGSDEAAAKAAGHELRGASEYLRTGVGLCVPPMCLLDYKGFRMLAQAHLNLGSSSLKMGTNDGGRTVLNDCPILDRRAAEAARALGLRAHIVGGRQAWVPYRDAETRAVYRRKRNVGGQVLHSAADVEGHKGADSRLYLLDLARAFPPEDPDATPHLSGMLSVSAKVVVQKEGEKAKAATVTKAHATLVDYDILYPDGTVEEATPAHMLRDLRLFIFYRLLRPEFVRNRGRKVLDRLKLPAGHKFPTVKVTNPMMFAITFARSAAGGGGPKRGKKAAIKDKPSSSAPSSTSVPGEQHGRYAAGSPENVTPPSGGGSPPARSAYSTGDVALASVSEASAAPEGAYEEFGSAEDAGYDEASGGGGGSVGQRGSVRGLGDEPAPDGEGLTAHQAWKRNAMECGITFVSTKDSYFEGFEESEVEEDEEELKRRGGIGYRQFHEAGPADGYDAAELDGGGGGNYTDDAGSYRDSLDPGTKAAPPNGVVRRPASGLGVGVDRSRERGAAAAAGTGGNAVPEEKRRFDRRDMLQKERTRGKEAVAREHDGNGSDDTNSETSDIGEEAVNDYTGFDTASESSSMFSAGVHINSERYLTLVHTAQNQSGGGPIVHPASSPAGATAGSASGSGRIVTGRRPNQNQNQKPPTRAFDAEGGRGYDPFSSKSLNSQPSQDMAPGSPISSIVHHATSRGMASSPPLPPKGRGGVEGSSVGGRAGAAAAVFRRRDKDRGGDGVGKDSAAASAAAEPEVLLPSAGGGYDQFSSKSLVSNGSCSSMSELSVPPLTSRGLGGDGGGRAKRRGLDGGPGGDADDGDMAPDGYSAFKPSSQTGMGGVRSHHRGKSISSSTEGMHGGRGGGGGSSSLGSTDATGGHRRQVSPAGVFGGAVDESSVVEVVPATSEGKRRSSKAKIWPVAGEEGKKERAPPPARAVGADIDDGDDGGNVDVGVDGGGGSGYDGFVPQPAGYEEFNDHDNDGALPPPRSLSGAPGYDSFQASKGSNRSIASSMLSTSTFDKHAAPPSPLAPPPPPRAAVSSRPPSSSPPQARPQPKPPLEHVATAEGQKNGPSAKAGEIPVRMANGGTGGEKGGGIGNGYGGGRGNGRGRPPPLSPDALTAFSNGDPEAKDRNRDVTEATQFLLTVLVPATAMLLCAMEPTKLSTINLSQKLHEYGVNMRHIGLLRAYVTPPSRGAASSSSSNSGSGSGSRSGSGSASASAVARRSGKTSAGIMRDRALVEVVVRTLKLVLRGFQRRWMKSEQSSSEQGMHLLVTQFLNLVTGFHERSHIFWQENVTTGICQRFGTVALTESERAGLWTVCSDRADLLLTIVKELVKVTGVRFKESVNQKLRSKSAKSIIVGFKFDLNDIRDIEAVVTPMTIYQ